VLAYAAMLDLNGSLGVGSGYASTLVQVHLGIGLVLLILTSAASSVPALRKQLEGTGWEASVKGAAAAAGPAPLLAVFALIQASSAPSDILTWAGLLASTSAVMLGTLHVMCCPCFGLEMPIVNSRSGAIFCAASANDTRSGACLSMAARMLSSLRACGEVLLILSSLPVGVQLIAASVLIRLALAVHVLEACAHVLSLQSDGGVLSGKRAHAESAMAIVPLIGSLALMDYLVSGPSSVLLGFVQPILYCAALVLVQMGLVMVVRSPIDRSTGGHEQPECDTGDSVAIKRFSRLTMIGLHGTIAISVLRILAGVIGISASTSGLSVQWGEPHFATAGLLAALLAAVHIAEFMVPAGQPGIPNTMDHLKAIVMPVQSLILALVVSHMQVSESLDSNGVSAVFSLLFLPLRCGFILAAAGVGCQLFLLALFDGTGTSQWQQEGKVSSAPVTHIREAALLLLPLGLLLGWISLGVKLWVLLGIVTAPCTYFFLPAQARNALVGILGACCSAVKGSVDYLFSYMQAYAEQRQYAKDVLHAKKADAMAAEVEKEMATTSSEAKGIKQSKGVRSKPPTSAETKTGKAKRASTGRQR